MDGPAVGVDVGATLAKLAVREATGELSFGFLPASALDAITRRIDALAPSSLGITGCGAAALEQHLDCASLRCLEFDAWCSGADGLLERQESASEDPYLLVSLGTGTSVLRVQDGKATRLGGTALGGGTVLGLGVALTGCESYDELCALAREGHRGSVDLLVSDIYGPGEISLPGETTAAAFGNLARWLSKDARAEEGPPPSRREDLAAAVMGLVGENVALICCGLALSAKVSRIVYGGASMLDNPTLSNILVGVSIAYGAQPLLLADGGFAGAVGAMTLAIGD